LIFDDADVKKEEIKGGGGGGTEQDKIIEEYEQRIALSIATLNTELKKEIINENAKVNIEEFKISPQKELKEANEFEKNNNIR